MLNRSLKIVLEQTFFLIWFFSFYRNAMHEYLANLSVWKFPTAGKWKRKKITSKVGQRQIRHRIGFLKLFFQCHVPEETGNTLTDFWLKCFIIMAYLKLLLFVLTKTLFWWPLLIIMTLNNTLVKMKKSTRAVPPYKKQLKYF
jgi:hypothetical protein